MLVKTHYYATLIKHPDVFSAQYAHDRAVFNPPSFLYYMLLSHVKATEMVQMYDSFTV